MDSNKTNKTKEKEEANYCQVAGIGHSSLGYPHLGGLSAGQTALQELSNKAKVTLPPRSLELPRDAADGGQMTNAPLCDELKAINAAIAAHIATVDANNVVGGTAGQVESMEVDPEEERAELVELGHQALRLEEQGVNTGGLFFDIFSEIAQGLLFTPVGADAVGQALVGHPAGQDDVGEAGGQVESVEVDPELVDHLHHAKRLGGHEAAAIALCWLEKGSNTGLHFDQAIVAFKELPNEVQENFLSRAILLMHTHPKGEEKEEGASRSIP